MTPIFIPNNLDVEVKAGERMIVEAIAISDEAESKAICVEIAWDGVWVEDSNEMARHLVVKEVACT